MKPAADSASTIWQARPLSRDKADTLLLLFACSLVLIPHAAHLPISISLACAALLLWRSWITLRGNRMPPRWMLLPVVGAATTIAYWQYQTLLGRDAGVAMLVLLLALKSLEMRARRDLFVVIFLSFFLMLTNFFYSQGIGTALLMLLAVLAILTAQLSFQFTGVVPPLLQRVKLAGFIFGLALPLTLVLFLLFPRIQGPLWGLPSDAHAGRSGLSDSMAPGNIAQLALSDEIAFRVEFFDPAPPKSKLYWRGVVLGDYDGRTWTQLQSRRTSDVPALFTPRGAPIRQRITLEASGRRWLFGLELPQRAPSLPDNSAGFSSDLQLLAAQPLNGRVRYEVTSYVDFTLQPQLPPIALQDWLELPPGFNPQTLEFAARLRNQSADNLQLVNTVLQYFRRNPFRYTLEPPLLGVNAVDDFLFGTRAGFCEHYASAFVVLMRALDIPARVVTGYQGGEINPVDGFMTVRQSDAHAWAEVWIAQRGWLRVDPTAAVAPERIERNLGSAIPRTGFNRLLDFGGGDYRWLSGLRANWDAANNAWNQWVLNYTPQRQRSLLRAFGFKQVDWRALTIALLVIGSLFMLAISVPLLRQRAPRDALALRYRVFCQRMARAGQPRLPHEGPRAYQLRLASAWGAQPARLRAALKFLQTYEQLRYAPTTAAARALLMTQLKLLLAKSR